MKASLSLVIGATMTLATFMRAEPAHGAHVANGADSVPALARYFAGTWHCRGGTPAGRTLESDVVFTMMLGARWLSTEHTDVPPGRYHAYSLWPADTARHAVLSTIYDNFGGARRFFATWGADSIVWMRDTTEAGARLESFTYRRVSDSAYWYAWHVRPAAGRPMVLGDSATCVRAGSGKLPSSLILSATATTPPGAEP